MSRAISERARIVKSGLPQGPHLRVLPILGPSHERPPYRMLDGETCKSVLVSEVSEAGSVPELVVQNNLDLLVYLMDGQELVGAKQNRILNTDVLMPAKATLKIPVSCVEQGRWRSVSETFTSGKSASHRTRSSKQERVRYALRTKGTHDANQAAVWDEVEQSLAASQAISPTMALSDAYTTRAADLTSFRASLQLPSDAVGIAVFHGGTFKGLDLFDRHATLKYFWDSIVDSYAVELLAQTAGAAVPPAPHAEIQGVQEVLSEAASAAWEPFRTPGAGEEWRVEHAALSGSALVWEEVLVHLQVFPKQEPNVSQQPRARIHRPHLRHE